MTVLYNALLQLQNQLKLQAESPMAHLRAQLATSPTSKKDETETKEQEKYYCYSCPMIFSHAPSLNRHRINEHNTEVKCLLCGEYMKPGETVKDHLKFKHHTASFTCSCCCWSFHDKKAFNAHAKSMKESEYSNPGDTKPIAKGPHPPGALSQVSQRNKRESSLGLSSSGGSSGSASPRQQQENSFAELLKAIMTPPAPIGSRKRKQSSSPPMKIIIEDEEQPVEAPTQPVLEAAKPTVAPVVNPEEVAQKRVKLSKINDMLLERAKSKLQ